MSKRMFDQKLINNLRELPLVLVIKKLMDLGLLYLRMDVDYVPQKAQDSKRLFVSLPSGEVKELVVTDKKWFDVHTKKGGGGCIDLTMHVLSIDFVPAIKILRGCDFSTAIK